MPRLQVRSLYVKVVFPIVALVLAGLAAVSYFAMREMREGVRAVAAERARYGLAYVRSAVEDSGNRDMADRNHIQALLERLTINPDVDTARVLATSGTVVFSSDRAELGRTMPVHAPADPALRDVDDTIQIVPGRPEVLHASGPILNRPHCATCHGSDKAVLAYVDVDISLSRQSEGMRTWGTMAAGAAVALFALTGAGIVLIMGAVVVGPIRRLAARMSQVQHGSLDVTAERSGTIEIDDLVSGFNSMVGRLERARQAEQESQRKHLARVEQLATLGEVAASLAHEIRNPLAGTKAAIDVLAGEEKAEEPKRILRHISGELARVDGVVRQLLNFAKPKSPALAKVDLRALLDSALTLAGLRAAEQDVAIELERPVEPLEVLADSDMVLQVVINLIINAIQAAQGAPGAKVAISAGLRDGMVACTVRDNGAGVPADRADSIFRPFVTTKPQGTGLGLATSRRLIELHGGRLRLENPGGPGAIFTFTLRPFAGHQTDRT